MAGSLAVAVVVRYYRDRDVNGRNWIVCYGVAAAAAVVAAVVGSF